MDGGGKGGRERGREGEEDDLNLGLGGRWQRRRGEQEQERASPLVGKAAAEDRARRRGAGQGRAAERGVAAGYSRDGWDGSGMANGMKHRAGADADDGVGGGARKETWPENPTDMMERFSHNVHACERVGFLPLTCVSPSKGVLNLSQR